MHTEYFESYKQNFNQGVCVSKKYHPELLVGQTITQHRTPLTLLLKIMASYASNIVIRDDDIVRH